MSLKLAGDISRPPSRIPPTSTADIMTLSSSETVWPSCILTSPSPCFPQRAGSLSWRQRTIPMSRTGRVGFEDSWPSVSDVQISSSLRNCWSTLSQMQTMCLLRVSMTSPKTFTRRQNSCLTRSGVWQLPGSRMCLSCRSQMQVISKRGRTWLLRSRIWKKWRVKSSITPKLSTLWIGRSYHGSEPSFQKFSMWISTQILTWLQRMQPDMQIEQKQEKSFQRRLALLMLRSLRQLKRESTWVRI